MNKESEVDEARSCESQLTHFVRNRNNGKIIPVLCGSSIGHSKEICGFIDSETEEKEIAKATKDPFDYVEPCEPECSAERHAYHQGQWDMACRMTDGDILSNRPN